TESEFRGKNTWTPSRREWIRVAQDLGLDGIELYEPFISNLDESEMLGFFYQLQYAGLQASSYTIESHLCNPADREVAVSHVKRAVDKARIFRTDIVRVVAGHGSRGLDKEVVLQSISDGLKACLDYAEEKGVMLALEDHFEVLTDIVDFMKVLEMVSDDRLKVNLDTANAVNGTAVDLAKLVAHRVVYTHLSDRKGDSHGVIVGTGDIDFKGVFKILKGAGYDGWLSTEGFVGGTAGLRFTIEHLRKAWNSA
ncbi:MAG: sugar phosphate isomerase/epimerase family protein, partial [Candidatus Thorarchaeota archaeon]